MYLLFNTLLLLLLSVRRLEGETRPTAPFICMLVGSSKPIPHETVYILISLISPLPTPGGEDYRSALRPPSRRFVHGVSLVLLYLAYIILVC